MSIEKCIEFFSIEEGLAPAVDDYNRIKLEICADVKQLCFPNDVFPFNIISLFDICFLEGETLEAWFELRRRTMGISAKSGIYIACMNE